MGPMVQTIDFEDTEYIQKKLAPLFAGIAIGVLVFVGYLLFFLISLCCKCCSMKRGCCQKPEHKQYKQRLPYVALVGVVAILGAVGGIMVLSAGPKAVAVVDDFIGDVIKLV